jgi:hypothetical protein
MKLSHISSLLLIFVATMAINAVPLVNVSLQESHSITVASDQPKPGGGPRDPVEVSLKYS